MLYIAQFQRNRQDYLKQHRRIRSLVDQNFALCSHEYRAKFPARPSTPNAGYSHNQTLVFLSRLSTSGTVSEAVFLAYDSLCMSKQTTGVVSVDDELSIQGQGLRNRTEDFCSYYSRSIRRDHRRSNQQPTEIKQENKDSTMTFVKGSGRINDIQISTDHSGRFSTRWQDQLSGNTYRSTKSSPKGNQWPNSVSLLFPTLTDSQRCPTAPLILEANNRRGVSTRIQSSVLSRSPTPLVSSPLVDSFEDMDSLSDSTFLQFNATMQKNDAPSLPQPYLDPDNENHFLGHSRDVSSVMETMIKESEEPKTLRRKSQSTVNGFQHIANLGSWQRSSKTRPLGPVEKSKEIDYEDDSLNDRALFNSSKALYEYSSPFPEEFDQAISFQAQLQISGCNNDWNLKDFYHDTKTQLDPDTNTKPVFEKCLKLARLQANTIRWEQRRRQNLTTYNRLIKNIPLDTNLLNLNGSFPLRNGPERDTRDINELRRELRCTECKRLACLGNCAPGQEYHQYKRFTTFSSLPAAREQVRCKLNVRPQRSTSDPRPRSMQQIIPRENKLKFDQTNLSPMVVVPLFAPEPPVKRPQKKFTSSFLPSKSFRSQRKETLTLVSSHKILS